LTTQNAPFLSFTFNSTSYVSFFSKEENLSSHNSVCKRYLISVIQSLNFQLKTKLNNSNVLQNQLLSSLWTGGNDFGLATRRQGKLSTFLQQCFTFQWRQQFATQVNQKPHTSPLGNCKFISDKFLFMLTEKSNLNERRLQLESESEFVEKLFQKLGLGANLAKLFFIRQRRISPFQS